MFYAMTLLKNYRSEGWTYYTAVEKLSKSLTES